MSWQICERRERSHPHVAFWKMPTHTVWSCDEPLRASCEHAHGVSTWAHPSVSHMLSLSFFPPVSSWNSSQTCISVFFSIREIPPHLFPLCFFPQMWICHFLWETFYILTSQFVQWCKPQSEGVRGSTTQGSTKPAVRTDRFISHWMSSSHVQGTVMWPKAHKESHAQLPLFAHTLSRGVRPVLRWAQSKLTGRHTKFLCPCSTKTSTCRWSADSSWSEEEESLLNGYCAGLECEGDILNVNGLHFKWAVSGIHIRAEQKKVKLVKFKKND